MSKDKWVRRFSVDETSRHKNGFTIYKITSVLFPIDSPETMTVVAVWKRYSDVQRLHASMKALHAGLHLRGTFPVLPKFSYFKRFQPEVIEERAKVIKSVLEFVAEHKLLFTSTDFVNFLQSGFDAPPPQSGAITAIRSALRLPAEEAAPLESPDHTESQSADEVDYSSIPVHEGAEVGRAPSPAPRLTPRPPSPPDSFDSIESLDSIGSDLYSELDKVPIHKHGPMVKKPVLPDLINFDAPSTSRFDDYHTMRTESDSLSLSSTRSTSRISTKSVLSLSNLSTIECKTKTEDSYVFEAGYMLNLAARYEEMKEYSRAFECYKAGIEKMLIGVQSDTDPQRRALIKEKTNKYLTYAEAIYKNHLCDADQSLVPEREETSLVHCPMPLNMLRRPYEDLSLYRVIAVLGAHIMLVLHRGEQTCYAMKVIQKVPNNLTEFDEYFLQNTNETRQPILPTVIPYMVQLHSYIETNNLIFLILSYAPGEKLLDYIKNYAKSIPNTPQREVNLENVFTEPKMRKQDAENENNSIIEVTVNKDLNSEINIVDRTEDKHTDNNNIDDKIKTENIDNIETSNIVLNSQKLIKNVDKILHENPKDKMDNGFVKIEDIKIEIEEVEKKKVGEGDRLGRRGGTPRYDRPPAAPAPPPAAPALPPATPRRWGAQILTALESLHNCGVICRDLNPSNILLGEKGQIILTYFISYPGLEMALSKLQTKPGEVNMYIAPELYSWTYVDDREEALDRVCDFWSFGAIMYELLCGVPLSCSHRGAFTAHTPLQLPAPLPVEVQSLLTQLLTFSPAERLGAGGIDEIKRHPYFKSIHWQEVYNDWAVPG